ncbi:uncharacterized protein LOC5515398 [Nematostella vectensis]|uniref:uncharacterized protein LOC5515398 n=1 Tax=Nematostella vectensis TaxID=45351 RepID=UPI002077929E|nr:uncharacterized protein LOC5515398 [Nematostella vectensis]
MEDAADRPNTPPHTEAGAHIKEWDSAKDIGAVQGNNMLQAHCSQSVFADRPGDAKSEVNLDTNIKAARQHPTSDVEGAVQGVRAQGAFTRRSEDVQGVSRGRKRLRCLVVSLGVGVALVAIVVPTAVVMKTSTKGLKRSAYTDSLPDTHAWSSWTTCSVTCGGGSQSRTRNCASSAPIHNYTSNCSDDVITQQTKHCGHVACPESDTWTAWSTWTMCSEEGRSLRERYCTRTSIQSKASDCKGPHQESKPCPLAGSWSAWSNWAHCDTEGHSSRARNCTRPAPRHGRQDCQGTSRETKNCTLYRSCGSILRYDAIARDTSTGYAVPAGWLLCYIDQRDTSFHATPCQDLIVHVQASSLRGYADYQALLGAGGNFGCWHGHTGATYGPSNATNNVIKEACKSNVQQTDRLDAWDVSKTTFGVCIKLP